LIEYNDVYEYFFNNSPNAMYISLSTGRFLAANSKFEKLIGYSKNELEFIEVKEVYAINGERRRFVYEIESKGYVKDFNIKLKTISGEIIECEIDAVAWKSKELPQTGYMGTIKPVKKEFLVPKEPADNKFNLAIKGSNDGLWTWNIHTNEIIYSSRWKALLGYSEYEIKNNITEWFSRIHPDDVLKFKKNLTAYIKNKEGHFNAYVRMLHKDDTYKWMMCRGIIEHDEQSKSLKMAGSLCNISNHINVIENLKKKENELLEVNSKLKDEYDSLSKYFSKEMIELINGSKEDELKIKKVKAVCIYLKIKDCFEIMNKLSLETSTSFIHDILVDIMDMVYGNNGSVNKILGDSIIVTYGCPIPSENDLENALNFVFEVVKYLDTYNDVQPEYLKEKLVIEMGLSYGNVFCGSVGSVRRLEYTVTGEPVNRAYALQFKCRKNNSFIMTDSSIINILNDKLEYKEISSVSINGGTPEKIYSLIDRKK